MHKIAAQLLTLTCSLKLLCEGYFGGRDGEPLGKSYFRRLHANLLDMRAAPARRLKTWASPYLLDTLMTPDEQYGCMLRFSSLVVLSQSLL